MIQLTTNILQTNIVRWRVIAIEVATGTVTLRFEGTGGVQSIDVPCVLSDTVNGSRGVALNAAPVHWDDRVIPAGDKITGGVGAANSLSNARSAYVTAYATASGGVAAKQAAGLKAIELQALADGWVSSDFAGT